MRQAAASDGVCRHFPSGLLITDVDASVRRIIAFLDPVEQIGAGSEPGIDAGPLQMQRFELPLIGIIQRLGWPEEVDRCLIHEHENGLPGRIGSCSTHK